MRTTLIVITSSLTILGCGSTTEKQEQPKRFPVISASTTLGFIDEKGSLVAETDLLVEDGGKVESWILRISDWSEDYFNQIQESVGSRENEKLIEQTLLLSASSRWMQLGWGVLVEAVAGGDLPSESRGDRRLYQIASWNFSEGRMPWASAERWGFIGEDGQFVVNPQFELALRYAEGLAPVKLNDRWGYADASGKVVITPTYDAALPFSEGRAAVHAGGRCGYVDRTGRLAVSPSYAICLPFVDGAATVMERDNARAGVIDKDGKVLIAPQFEAMSAFSGKHAAAKVGGQWGLVDRSGRFVVPPQFAIVIPPVEGDLWLVRLGDRWGFVDATGKYVIGPTLDAAFPFLGGVARVQAGERWGFMKPDGTYLSGAGATYDAARDMFNGRAAVQMGERWGFIDDAGSIVVSPTYDDVGDFLGALAPVSLDGGLGYIDRAGKVILFPEARGSQVGNASGGTREAAYVASMKADLRNLLVAQEAHFADNVTYGSLSDLANYYSTSAGVSVTVVADGGRGWSAEARHSSSSRRCVIAVGSLHINTAATEGEPVCR